MTKSNVFEHKGYVGSVEFSLEDGILTGKILFIEDLVNYEAETLVDLKQAFIHAVDNYLAVCKEEGIDANKPCSGTFNVRVSPDLHRKVQVEAARRAITLNEFVRISLEHEISGERYVTIHNHEHSHHHTHASSAQLEVTATFKEPTKWKHESATPLPH